MDNKEIGEKIKEIRKKNKLTQSELAKKIDKTLSSIQKYEKGDVDISFNVLNKIAQVLNTDLSYLLGFNISDNYKSEMAKEFEPKLKNIYDEIVKNKDEKPLYIEKNLLFSKIDELLEHNLKEYIFQYEKLYKLEYTPIEIELLINKMLRSVKEIMYDFYILKVQEYLESRKKDNAKDKWIAWLFHIPIFPDILIIILLFFHT